MTARELFEQAQREQLARMGWNVEVAMASRKPDLYDPDQPVSVGNGVQAGPTAATAATAATAHLITPVPTRLTVSLEHTLYAQLIAFADGRPLASVARKLIAEGLRKVAK